MYKRLELKDKNIEVLTSYDDRSFQIKKGYFINDELIKTISFKIDGSVFIECLNLNSEDKNNLEFEFDIGDPLYYCFNRYLGDRDEVIVDDDKSKISMRRYMKVFRKDNIINVKFSDLTKNNNENSIKMVIYNINYRNKNVVDKHYLKQQKLIELINDMRNILIEEEHQMTLDEYMAILKYKEHILEEKLSKYEKHCCNCEWIISPELEYEIMKEQGYLPDDIRPLAGDCCIGMDHGKDYTCHAFDVNDTISYNVKNEVDAQVLKKII